MLTMLQRRSDQKLADAANATSDQSAYLVLIFTLVILLAIYLPVRYRGQWNGTGDTARITQATEPVLLTGELVPEGEAVYANGYGYQALSVFLVHLTGLSLDHLQLLGGLFLIAWLVLPAWILFRELLQDSANATLASAIVFLNSDFLFVIMRGTHEKFTRGLIILALYLLLRSLRSQRVGRSYPANALAFYLLAFALSAFNNYFATSFLFVTLVAILALLTIAIWQGRADHCSTILIRRLVYVLLSSAIIVFVYTFYLYAPAHNNVLLASSVFESVQRLLFHPQELDASGSYGYVDAVWRNRYAYFGLSAPSLLLLISSAVVWVWQTGRLALNRREPVDDQTLVLWAFYAAFVGLGLLSIAVDLSRSVLVNTQNRAIPSIVMLASPLVVSWLGSRKHRLTRRTVIAVMGAAMLAALLSTLKVSNEPTLTTQWTFHNWSELEALRWAQTTLPRQTNALWTGLNERLATADMNTGARSELAFDSKAVSPSTRDFLLSNIIAERARRVGVDLPIPFDALVTYDNGNAQIYHIRPVTAFQK